MPVQQPDTSTDLLEAPQGEVVIVPTEDVIDPLSLAAMRIMREAPSIESLRVASDSEQHFLDLRRKRHWGIVDAIEVLLTQFPGAEVPVAHNYTPGLYSREMRPVAGTLMTSRIHMREHQWVLSQGACLVWTEEQGEPVLIRAPHRGVTKPGTRRIIFALEDTIWTTFHPLEADLDGADLDTIEARLYERRDDHLRGLVPLTVAEHLKNAGKDDIEGSNLCRHS